jgi:adenylate cyclase, class 2
MRAAGKKARRKMRGDGSGAGRKEIEVKIRIRDRDALMRQLKNLKAKAIGARLQEMNTLYDTAGGHLARRGEMLRIRVEHAAGKAGSARKVPQKNARGSALLTYKGPGVSRAGARQGRKYKIREEREVRIADAQAMARIYEALGLRPWFRYEKFRSTYRLPKLEGVKLEFDQTPIGDFLEIEGDQQAIDRSAALLGFGPEEYITLSYGALHMQQCGLRGSRKSGAEPVPHSGIPDMLFANRK